MNLVLRAKSTEHIVVESNYLVALFSNGFILGLQKFVVGVYPFTERSFPELRPPNRRHLIKNKKGLLPIELQRLST